MAEFSITPTLGKENPTDSDYPGGSCAIPGCANPLPEYAGRGRKPTKCDEHKKSSSGSSSAGSSRATGSAKTASANLDNLYEMMTAGLVLIGSQSAAVELEKARPILRERNEQFLQADPKLAARINKIFAGTGSAGFFLVNGMTIAPIVWGGVQEFISNRNRLRRETATYEMPTDSAEDYEPIYPTAAE